MTRKSTSLLVMPLFSQSKISFPKNRLNSLLFVISLLFFLFMGQETHYPSLRVVFLILSFLPHHTGLKPIMMLFANPLSGSIRKLGEITNAPAKTIV